MDEKTLMIPLLFWSNKDPRLSLPIGIIGGVPFDFRGKMPEDISKIGGGDFFRDYVNPGNANMQNKNGDTVLIVAARYGRSDNVRAALEMGADVSMVDNGGMTALMWASKHGYSKCLRLLLDAGADPDLQDAKGETALMKASHKSPYEYASNEDSAYTDCVKFLLYSGADVNIVDNKGEMALVNADPQRRYLLVRIHRRLLFKIIRKGCIKERGVMKIITELVY